MELITPKMRSLQEAWFFQSSGLETTFVTFWCIYVVYLIKIDRVSKDLIPECYFRHQVHLNILKMNSIAPPIWYFQKIMILTRYHTLLPSHGKSQLPIVIDIQHIHSGSEKILTLQGRYSISLYKSFTNAQFSWPSLFYSVWIMVSLLFVDIVNG